MKKLLILTVATIASPAHAWTTGNPQKDMAIEKAYEECADLWPFTINATSGKNLATECAKEAFDWVNKHGPAKP